MARKKVVVRTEGLQSDATYKSSNHVRIHVRYGECLRNIAFEVGGFALDGCREFIASTAEGTDGELICAACDCHRSFHMRIAEPDQAV